MIYAPTPSNYWQNLVQQERQMPTIKGHLNVLHQLKKVLKAYNSIQRNSLPPDSEKAALALTDEFRARLKELRERA